jgi:hypothetical protein
MDNDDEKIVRCGGCNILIGGVVERNGKTGLLMSLVSGISIVVYRLHGWCIECGAQVHWDSQEIRLRRLINHDHKYSDDEEERGNLGTGDDLAAGGGG